MSEGPMNASSAPAGEPAQEPAVVAEASGAPAVIIPDPPPATETPAPSEETNTPEPAALVANVVDQAPAEEPGEGEQAGEADGAQDGCESGECGCTCACESADDAASEEPSEDGTDDVPAEEQAAAPEPAPETVRPPESAPVPPALPASALVLRHRLPGPLAMLKLEKVDEDSSFRLRDEGDIDSLATSMAKLGQLFPVDLRLRPPDRFQVVTGFRRVAALRLLKRERVLARVHTDLSDEDALRLALADLLESRVVEREELSTLRDRLRDEGRLTPAVSDTLERAISPPDETLSPETVEDPEEEVDLDTLAQDVIGRLAAINQDLAIVAELWSALDRPQRETLLEQLGYSSQLVTYLRGLR